MKVIYDNMFPFWGFKKTNGNPDEPANFFGDYKYCFALGPLQIIWGAWYNEEAV